MSKDSLSYPQACVWPAWECGHYGKTPRDAEHWWASQPPQGTEKFLRVADHLRLYVIVKA